MVFGADQKDARHMPRADGCLVGEEGQANAVQQAEVAPVLRMKVLFLSSQLAHLTQTLHVEKVRVNLQTVSHLGQKNSKKWSTLMSVSKSVYLLQSCSLKIKC